MSGTRRIWQEHFIRHKKAYPAYAIIASVTILMSIGHDMNIWSAIQEGSADISAIDQLYYKGFSYQNDILFFNLVLFLDAFLVGYILLIWYCHFVLERKGLIF